MGAIFKKHINQNFFKIWTPEMSYILGYITADGCIAGSKDRKKHPFSLNITSTDLKHLYLIRETLESEHKINKKSKKIGDRSYQIQIRNPVITTDLIRLGILPRKTYNLNPINTSDKYFSDFVRGFFDGDGTVYIYKVNGTPQIKAEFVSSSFSFITEFNRNLCSNLLIFQKAIHSNLPNRQNNLTKYSICFYVDDCEKLAQFMYEDNPVLYLPRKRQIFENWKSIKRRRYIKQNYPSKIGWQLNQNVSV